MGRLFRKRANRYKKRTKNPFRSRQSSIEPLEPRRLLAADLIYADLAATPDLNPTDITGYLASVVSTNYTLRAEDDSGTLYWRLFGTGTDLLPIPETQVLEHEIDDAGDLEVNITRDDLGATDIVAGLSLIDFVGDKLTVELDTLAVLDGTFSGTPIEIDFEGGKDIDLGAIFGVTFPVPLGNDQVIVTANGSTFNNHDLNLHSSSDIVNDATGVQITAGSDIEFKSDSTVTINNGSSITANNLSLRADATGAPLVKGLRANAAGTVNVDGATLTASTGTVTVNALGKVDMTGTNAEDGDTFFNNSVAGTLVTSFSTATVNIVGTTTITAATLTVTAEVDSDIEATVEDGTVKLLSVWAAGDPRVNIGDTNGTTTINVTGEITAEAKTNLDIDAESKPGTANNNATLDAAVVNVNVVDVGIPVVVPAGFTSGANMTVGGGAVITAGTKAAFKATDSINVTTTADGEITGTAGATLGGTVVDSNTIATITGTATVNAPIVDLLASTTRTLVTTAKSTPGGAEDDNGANTDNQTQQALSDNNASTSDGDLTIAAAVAVSHTQGTTEAFVDSTASTAVTASTALNVSASSTDSVSAIADATGTGNPGLAIAAAINHVDLAGSAWLGGTALNLQTPTVNVTATMDADNTFKAEATSGAGASGVGVAGALAINSIDTSVRAFVDSGAAIDLNAGTINLTATSTTKSVADAKPKEDGVTGESLGLGASVAMNLVENLTEAMVETNANVSGGTAVNLVATGDHTLETKATMSASGGTAVTPVVAMTFTTNTTRTVFDTGSTVSVTGNVDAEATQDVDITTEGTGDAEGSNALAIGAVLAFVSASDVVTAQAAGTVITTGGNIALKSRSHRKSKADSKASAAGAFDQGNTVDQQVGNQQDTAAAQGGTGSTQNTPSVKTSDGPVAVAAAVSLNVAEADVRTTVTGQLNAANGTVTLSSLVNQDDSSVADGEATKAGSVGVGAAVAISRIDVVNVAQVQDGGLISADGITIDAGMRDVSGDKQHDFTSHARSGAGSESDIGVAGALGMTISTTDTTAGITTGGTVTLADGSDGNSDVGELAITANEDAKNTAKAEPTVSGDNFGFGASVAMAIPTHLTTAEVENDAIINGVNNVTLLAKSNLETDSYAKAGVKAGVAISPVVAVTMAETITLARVGSGTPTVVTGNLSITADHTGDNESHAAGSVESTDAAIGMAIATTTTDENEDARLERSITAAGNITVEAVGLHDASADSKASATGAKDEDTDNSNQNVDQRAAAQTTTATEQQQQASNDPVATPPGVATVTFATSESTLDVGDQNTLRSLEEYLTENPMAVATV